MLGFLWMVVCETCRALIQCRQNSIMGTVKFFEFPYQRCESKSLCVGLLDFAWILRTLQGAAGPPSPLYPQFHAAHDQPSIDRNSSLRLSMEEFLSMSGWLCSCSHADMHPYLGLVFPPGISRPGISREKARFKIPVSRDLHHRVPGKILFIKVNWHWTQYITKSVKNGHFLDRYRKKLLQ